MVTFAQLRTLDAAVFRAAAGGYARLADTMALQSDAVDVAGRELAGWSGAAAAAATARLTELVDGIEQVRDRLGRLDLALSGHAAEMERAQRRLARVVVDIHSARRGQLTIDLDTGQVAVVREDSDGVPADPRAIGQRLRLADQVTREIERILADAAREDAETARRLAGILAARPAVRPPNADALLASLPAVGADPAAVRRWWSGLTAAEREFLIRTRPDVIGWLDGVPATDRDEANRLIMNATAAGLAQRRRALETKGPLTEREQAELDALVKRMAAIDAIRTRMAATDAGAERVYLLGFDTAGNGRALVAVGNPDTADNIVTYVPGTGAKLDGVRGDLSRADIMTREANTFDPTRRTAAICWIGYDAPQSIVPQAMKPGYAVAAGADLDRFQDGLRVTHEGGRAHHTVVGHSYGSTVVGYTAARHGIDADDLVFLGSPGVGTPTVAGLLGADGRPIPADHVWSSHAANDPIQYASYTDVWPLDSDGDLEPAGRLVHGTNPSEPQFGARTFRSDPGDPLRTMHAHSQYWDPYSTSLRNLTYVATGHPELVT